MIFLLFCFLCLSTHSLALLAQKPIRGSSPVVEPVDGDILPSARLASAPYAPWAHHHWVWLSNHVEDRGRELDLVRGYLERNVPVGAVDIDSEWSTGINNFVWDNKKFSNATAMVDEFHSLGVRVICWATSVVNLDSPNHQAGVDGNFYLNDGTPLKWWHGWGSWLDYTNPAALAWWHAAMDGPLVRDKIDGWKCDGTDPYVFEFDVLGGGIKAHSGLISQRDYANSYYRDFFEYSRSKNPDALIMARPVNDYWHFAPHDVMFSGWVGDNDPTFTGMKWALNDMLHSAWANYLNFGSDTGGYRGGGPKPFGRTKTLMIRWAQLSAFTPLFENGGEGEHRPWKFDNTNETLDIYREFVVMHMELNPYLLAGGAIGFAQNKSQITPLGYDLGSVYPTSFDFLLGIPANIFVSPITDDGTGTRKISFPEGEWADWFTNKTYSGPSEHELPFPLSRFPVYKRRGAIFALDVEHAASYHGFAALRGGGALTALVHLCAAVPRARASIAEWRAPGVELAYERRAGRLRFRASAHRRPLVLQLRGVAGAARVARVALAGVGALRRAASCAALAAAPVVAGFCVGDEAHGELLVRLGAEHTRRGTVLDVELPDGVWP